ncbi:MAG: hypothetical protein HS114_19300 [Anaerolineales bacterium]|nr:hypothetical protein [Anaerolineales bacterium]
MIIPQSFAPVNWLRQAVGAARQVSARRQPGGLSRLYPFRSVGAPEPGSTGPSGGGVAPCLWPIVPWPASTWVVGRSIGPTFRNRGRTDPGQVNPGSPRALCGRFPGQTARGQLYVPPARLPGRAPALVWVWVSARTIWRFAWGFDVEASLPTARHFGRVLRPCQRGPCNSCSTAPFPCCVRNYPRRSLCCQAISLDTKHILAWVKENNPKAYVLEGDRLDKTRQPKGDRDCKLGCKRAQCLLRGSQSRNHSGSTGHPDQKAKAVTNFSSSDVYYWGYGSAWWPPKSPTGASSSWLNWTQTFDKNDVTYFFALMAQVERRLGFKPKFRGFDAAFDPFYVFSTFIWPAVSPLSPDPTRRDQTSI